MSPDEDRYDLVVLAPSGSVLAIINTLLRGHPARGVQFLGDLLHDWVLAHGVYPPRFWQSISNVPLTDHERTHVLHAAIAISGVDGWQEWGRTLAFAIKDGGNR